MHSELDVAFGQDLQLERERLSISLETIAQATKVPTRHLRALELEQFDQLPGGIFAKGIVRSYCRHLGLDEEEWLRRFPSTTPQETSPEWVEFAEAVSRNRVHTSHSMKLRWWGVLLMITGLVVLSWLAWQFVLQPQILGATATSIAIG